MLGVSVQEGLQFLGSNGLARVDSECGRQGVCTGPLPKRQQAQLLPVVDVLEDEALI